MHEFSLECGSSTLPPSGYTDWASVRWALEEAVPKVADVIETDEFLADPTRWRGVYEVPNCPEELDLATSIAAYRCAVRRYGGKADRVAETKALAKKVQPFIDTFRAQGGISQYHWAFVRVHTLFRSSQFTYQRNSNAGLAQVFDAAQLTPWNLHKMFRQFPSGKVLCLRTVDAALNYRRRENQVLAEALRRTLETNHVQTGIAHVQAALPKEELRQLATAWRNTAKAVETSLSLRVKNGEDIWEGLFPGLEK